MFEISRPALLAMTLVCFALAQPARAQSTVPENPESMGQFLGARQTDHPDWFKESFLELEEDIAEATEQGKRLVVYFHQDGCPYCNKLVEENFTNPRILELMQDKFQLVAINMWGDREVVQVGGRAFSEKTLAAALDVDFTPTLLFFSEDRKVVLRLDGYYPPTEFIHALTYVSDKLENRYSFSHYLAEIRQGHDAGQLSPADWLEASSALPDDTGSTPVMVLFEEPDCTDCDLLHNMTFRDDTARNLLRRFTVIRLNRWSDETVTRQDGTPTTARQWAVELGLGFSPAIVLFDANGERIITGNAMFRTFHVLGMLDYVASGAYRHEPSFQRYLSERAERIRATGQDVNIWTY